MPAKQYCGIFSPVRRFTCPQLHAIPKVRVRVRVRVKVKLRVRVMVRVRARLGLALKV